MNIPGFQIIRELNSGGFGTVHLARRTSDGLPVAVKVLRLPTDENIRRLYREATVLHRETANPHVVNLIHANVGHAPPFIVMEYCSGGSLQSWVVQRRAWTDIVAALAHAAEGLRGIHAQGGFHRDIKPGNLLLALLASGQWIVKVGDFGLSRVPIAFSGPMTRSPWGTEGYIAPEVVFTRTHTAAADVYSLGVTGIELLTGSRNPAGLAGAQGPKALHDLLRSMVHADSARRPTMEACALRLGQPFDGPVAASKGSGGGGGLLALLGAAALVVGAVATANTQDANGRFHGSDGTFRSGRWG